MKGKIIAGIDLHSNNVMIGIVDESGRRLKHRKLPLRSRADSQIPPAVQGAAPEHGGGIDLQLVLAGGWIAEPRLPGTHLANPAQIEQYSGIKHADDKNDAFFLAELQRLNILPTGYIYDPVLRPVRDLLRRRLSLVHQRTALLLSFKSLYARTTGQAMSLSQLKAMDLTKPNALRASGQLFDRRATERTHRQAGSEHRVD